MQIFLLCHGGSYVVDDHDAVGHRAGSIEHRCDEQVVPEQAPVLAIVVQQHSDFASGLQALAHGGDGSVVAMGAQECLKILAEDFFLRVAGDSAECRIGIFDRAIGVAMVEDKDTIDARFDREAAQAQRLFGHAACSQIA